MSKNKAIIAATMMVLLVTGGIAGAVPSGPFGYDLQKDMHRSENKAKERDAQAQTQMQTQEQQNVSGADVSVKPTDAKKFYNFIPIADLFVDSVDNTVYYPEATMNSAIALYKKGNYTECLQQLYSYIKTHPNDAYAYYYMGLAYTKIGENNAAKNCYQKVINCNAQGKLLLQALKGRDCITGGVYCHAFDDAATVVANPESSDPLDKFISAPYKGNGFSPELEREYKQKELENLQREINRKNILDGNDLDRIHKLQNRSEALTDDKLAFTTGFAASITSEPSRAEVIEAIDVLKRAGLNISVDFEDKTSADVKKYNPADFMPSPEMQQLNMMLGNSNNNDPMMNMLPFMMNADSNGKNIDPQVVQAMMMNSMMGSINGLGNTDNK